MSQNTQEQVNDHPAESSPARLPAWLKRPMGAGQQFHAVEKLLRDLNLETVCSGAGCPNRGECFSCGTATFMILGSVCTRDCAFCGVRHGCPDPVAADEPERLAEAAARMNLSHIVVTSVTRDDLPDAGAAHFAATIHALRRRLPHATVEVLTPDFRGESAPLELVCEAAPDVFNHNIETTRRLTPEIRSGADYQRSLSVLAAVAARPEPRPRVKSGFMLGLGENPQEIDEMLHDLRNCGVEMVTIGQYLRPGRVRRPVARYYHPDEFAAIRTRALALGFAHVAAGPFVRSSYHAQRSLDDSRL